MSLLNIGVQGTSGWSQGGSNSAGWTDAQNWSNGSSYGYDYSHSASQSMSDWGGYSNGENWGHVAGREASAQDIMNANAANELNLEMWALQAAYNAKEAEKNRDYQTYMSNTAYQRAVEDLKKAGLNPILAAGAAASSPVGATASSGLSSASKANAFAEQTSYGYNNSKNWGSERSSSSSNSYGYHSSQNSSYGYSRGQNSASSYERSQYTNNIKEMASGITGLATGAISGIKTLSGYVADAYKNAANYYTKDKFTGSSRKY